LTTLLLLVGVVVEVLIMLEVVVQAGFVQGQD
jgi:hypothetical protein